MNKKSYSLFLALIFAAFTICHAQQPALAIYHSYSEKSKDSHSTIENIGVTGTVLTYAVKYTGRKGPDQKDESKKCTLTSEQVRSINKIISEKKLNVTDSLVDNTAPDKSYQVMNTITITITNGAKIVTTKVKGNPSGLKGKPLYKNAVSLYSAIMSMIKSCH